MTKDIFELEKMEEAEIFAEAITNAVVSTNDLIPQMNVSLTTNAEEEKIIPDAKLVGLYDEILDNVRNDRNEINNLIETFSDMVINTGDATSSTKEALVNLIKIKLDTSDKMSKIADLMTRVRGTNTFPKYLATNQNNTINIDNKKLSSNEKRALLKDEDKKQKDNLKK
jgi:hypothetical protein